MDQFDYQPVIVTGNQLLASSRLIYACISHDLDSSLRNSRI